MSTAVERPRERYISSTPGGGFLIRVTRAARPAYARDMEDAKVKRGSIFEELFGEPYSEEAANRLAYSSNKGSDRRGVEFVELRNGKSFWQVKYLRFVDQDDEQGRVHIKKFFVSRWGHKGGYDAAVTFKDQQDGLERDHRAELEKRTNQRKATQ